MWTQLPHVSAKTAAYRLLRSLAGLFEVLICFDDLPAAFDPDFDVRAPGILPIRGSPASTSSHARSAADSKSGASTGRTCQPVTCLPSTLMDRIFGNSRRKLWWCSWVVAS